MNPAYLLALKLGIPVVVQPAWDECQKLRKKARKLWEEENVGEVVLQKEGWKLWKEGEKLYRSAVAREPGLEYTDRIDWDTGEVR